MNTEPIEIIYLPHATTFDNEAGIATGAGEVAISPLGKEQIKALHQAMADQKFDVVFCSDLKRARETAEGIFGDRYQVIPNSNLREINIGELSGRSTAQTALLQKQAITKPWPGGESYQDIEKKMADFLHFLAANYSGKKVVIVGHQATQLALEVLLKNLSWQRAIDDDWRKTKAFQPGWRYRIPANFKLLSHN